MNRGNLKRKLQYKLPSEETKALISSFDVIGDIAIVKIPPPLEKRKALIAEAVMATNTNIRTVLRQVSAVTGDYRQRALEWIAGERKTESLYREHGCSFKVDLSKVYFSPRLSFEWMRVANLARTGEIIVNMFAGVGSFSIIIAKHSQCGKVYSIDINSKAVELMKENIVLNRLEGRIEAILGDARDVVEERFIGTSHRILMPLPAKAYEYLETACLALQSGKGSIHYYDFVYARSKEEAVQKVANKVIGKLAPLETRCDVSFSRVVRTVGPRWYQVVLDLNVAS